MTASSLTPEMVQCIIGAVAFLVGYVLRHLHISLPIVSSILESWHPSPSGSDPSAPAPSNLAAIAGILKDVINKAIDGHVSAHTAKAAVTEQVVAAVQAATAPKV